MRKSIAATIALALILISIISAGTCTTSPMAASAAWQSQTEVLEKPNKPIPPEQKNSLLYKDSDYGFSINYPAANWTATVTLENIGTPKHVIKRRLTLLGPQEVQINIDVWDGMSDFDLMGWFNQYQRPLLSEERLSSSKPNAQVEGVPAVFTIEPAGLYAPARLATVFLWNDRVFRVEYWAFDDGAAQVVYHKVLNSFKLADGPEIDDTTDLPSTDLKVSTFLPTRIGVDSCCGYNASGNPYPCGCGGGGGCGNCTWWAWYKRSAIGDALPSHSWGNAQEWDTRASSEGWTVVEGPPQEGAIIVLEPGEQGVDATYGHVAYVEEKISDSQCRVSDMWYQDGSGNCGCEGVCCRVCTWYQYHTNGSQVHFIYPSGGTCSEPTLNSPNDHYVHTSSDRTITFDWSAPADCTPDGYTFRVKTVTNMDSGGTTIFDEGQGGTQVTKQFGSEWDNTDLYWSVRACKPCTPFNPGQWATSRHFRIEPGSEPPPPDDAVDVYMLVDLSGSFVDDLPVFQDQAPDMISDLRASYPNSRFGLAKFEDYPIDPFGSAGDGDKAYERLVDLTFDTDTVLNTISTLFTRSGVDWPQSQLPALYQAATGAGQDLSTQGYPGASIPFGQRANFRDGATKIFVLWTDAPFHQPGDAGDIPYPGPSFEETRDAILALDPPMVIGISSGGGGLSDLEEMAAATGALAPPGGADCDGDGSVDIAAGEPLVCAIAGAGTGIGDAITGLVRAATGEGVAQPVGGVIYPSDRFRLLAPWVGLAVLSCSILASGIVAIRKRRDQVRSRLRQKRGCGVTIGEENSAGENGAEHCPSR